MLDIPKFCGMCDKEIGEKEEFCSEECRKKAEKLYSDLDNLIQKSNEILNDMREGEEMNIYLLENGNITEHRGCGYYKFVIVANDEGEARRVAFCEAVGNDTDVCDEEKRWMDGRASCVKIGNDENQYNMPFIVSENFNQGD